MRGMTVQVFDDFITSVATTWFTPATFNDILRSGDAFAIQAVTMAVGGSAPTLTVKLQLSEDNEHWVAEATAVINGQSISNSGSYGNSRLGTNPVLNTFARFAITLGGTSPKCRLKLFVTTRTYKLSARAQPAAAPAAMAEAKP